MVADRKSGVQKKKVDKSGLGRAIINRRKKAAAIAADPSLSTSELVHGLSSVTQENDLDEFLSTAQLADTDFTAERQNIKVISAPTLSSSSQHNPYLLTPQQEKEMREKQNTNRLRLQVPRRPEWNRGMTTVELERRERDSFLEWRRGLADLQDNQSLLLTPFERNLEVWRQLWRTLERSDLIVQIVDARNPLAFRSQDLAKYVEELNEQEQEREDELAEGEEPRPKLVKKNLLLINKSDLLTKTQRQGWADYFEKNEIQYAFFSAKNSTELQEERARREELDAEREALKVPQSDSADDDEASGDEEEEDAEEGEFISSEDIEEEEEEQSENEDEESDEATDNLAKKVSHGMALNESSPEADRTRILSVLELEDMFLSHAPEVSAAAAHGGEKLVVGLVGYPNVGKSSTINALIGEKKVSVSSTPGKTKHFQTIRLSPEVLLCDCPGLVFPQFAATKADLVCDGVLPIDQMREHTGPVALVTKRIPQEVLEGMYGLRIATLPVSEGGTGVPTASEFLTTYAIARGFFTGGQGNADESRASRFVLKDYVNGKLLYCHPPPGVTADDFNKEVRDMELLRAQDKIKTKKAPTTRVRQNADTYIAPSGSGASKAFDKNRQSTRAKALDRNFFDANSVGKPAIRGIAAEQNGTGEFTRVKMFGHQGKIGNDGTLLKNGTSSRQASSSDGKKHFKSRRQKQRSGKGYEDF